MTTQIQNFAQRPLFNDYVLASNLIKSPTTKVALLFFEQNSIHTALNTWFVSEDSSMEQIWHRHIHQLCKSHVVFAHPLPKNDVIDDSYLLACGNRSVDVYIIRHGPVENRFFRTMHKSAIERIDRIFLLMCHSGSLAKEIAQQTNKPVWAVGGEEGLVKPCCTHVMSESGDVIHFTKDLSKIISRVYTSSSLQPVPHSDTKILKDVAKRAKTCAATLLYLTGPNPLLNWGQSWHCDEEMKV